MCERVQRRERCVASVIENLLKLRRRFRASPQFQVRQAAQVLWPEFGGGLVACYRLQLLDDLPRIPALQFERSAYRRQPDRLARSVLHEALCQLILQRPRLFRFAAQRKCERGARQRNASTPEGQPLRGARLTGLAISQDGRAQRLLGAEARRQLQVIAKCGQINSLARKLLRSPPLPVKGRCASLPVKRNILLRLAFGPVKLLLHAGSIPVNKGQLIELRVVFGELQLQT